MQSFRFYMSRADLAIDLASRVENAHLRDKYLQLAEEWAAQADDARDAVRAWPAVAVQPR